MGDVKGGGGGNAGQYSPPQSAEGADYWSRYPDVQQSGMNPYYHFTQFGGGENRQWGIPAPPMPAFDFESVFAGLAQNQADQDAIYAQQQVDFAAEQQRMQEEIEYNSAISEIDMLYGGKMTAADKAATEVNSEIQSEMDSALTRGVDYIMSEDDRSLRINNRFAQYWSEADETSLTGMLGQWKPEGYDWTSSVVRGTDPTQAPTTPAPTQVGSRVRQSSTSPTTLTPDPLGTGTSVLGV